jgi:hypothetical protein
MRYFLSRYPARGPFVERYALHAGVRGVEAESLMDGIDSLSVEDAQEDATRWLAGYGVSLGDWRADGPDLWVADGSPADPEVFVLTMSASSSNEPGPLFPDGWWRVFEHWGLAPTPQEKVGDVVIDGRLYSASPQGISGGDWSGRVYWDVLVRLAPGS